MTASWFYGMLVFMVAWAWLEFGLGMAVGAGLTYLGLALMFLLEAWSAERAWYDD